MLTVYVKVSHWRRKKGREGGYGRIGGREGGRADGREGRGGWEGGRKRYISGSDKG